MKYYLAKVAIETEAVDKKGNMSQQTSKSEFIVSAESVTDAEKKVHEHLKDTMMDFEVTSVTATKVEAVI